MATTWLEVVDSALKIGLGALISAISGYLILIKTHDRENEKEREHRFYKLQEEQKLKYVELLVQSQHLIQSYLFKSCSPNADEYTDYLRVFNEVQIISNDSIRISAFDLMTKVSSFILMRKEDQETTIIDSMVHSAREAVSLFQKVAQSQVTKEYKKT